MNLHQEILDLFAKNSGDYTPTEQEKAAVNDGLAHLLEGQHIDAETASEVAVLCEMLLGASDHVLERHESERDRFISRARQLASLLTSNLGGK